MMIWEFFRLISAFLPLWLPRASTLETPPPPPAVFGFGFGFSSSSPATTMFMIIEDIPSRPH